MAKGGVYGSYVPVLFSKGTSKKFPLVKATGTGSVAANKAASEKSPIAYVKEPVAKFLGFAKISPTDYIKRCTKKVKTKINGKDEDVEVFTAQGATGASRSVTVKFKRPETIGGKSVASVKVAVPYSHTFGNMVDELANCAATPKIAQIVSYSGRTVTWDTPFKKQLVGTGKQKQIAGG
jgi:hypothetical protein